MPSYKKLIPKQKRKGINLSRSKNKNRRVDKKRKCSSVQRTYGDSQKWYEGLSFHKYDDCLIWPGLAWPGKIIQMEFFCFYLFIRDRVWGRSLLGSISHIHVGWVCEWVQGCLHGQVILSGPRQERKKLSNLQVTFGQRHVLTS